MKPPVVKKQITILVAPLDWGLGHATRSIPVIREFEKQGCKVILAGEGPTKKLLEQEFPHLNFINLKGYRISYSKNKWLLPLHIFFQIPKILNAIHSENIWLKKVISKNEIDIVASDNRYGLYCKKITSVFITHQLLIKGPLLLQKIIQKINYRYINKFSFCWIPDVAGKKNLAGELSHPARKPKTPTKYLGILSRLKSSTSKENDFVLIILSGPEPQRTAFEQIILNDLKNFKEQVVLVRGLPNDSTELNVASNVEVYNHLPAEKLEKKFASASFIISRSGYSTVMDIAAMKKKSILIPTPGQTEQEYLAQHLFKNNFALTVQQESFKLSVALDLAKGFNYNLNHFQNNSSLPIAVEELLNYHKSLIRDI